MEIIFLWFIIIIAIVYHIILAVMIAQNAGYSGAWGLVYFIPYISFVFLWIFAFADWAVLKNTDDQENASG